MSKTCCRKSGTSFNMHLAQRAFESLVVHIWFSILRNKASKESPVVCKGSTAEEAHVISVWCREAKKKGVLNT